MLFLWFYGEIKRYLRDNNSIRVSRSTRDLAYKVIQFKEKYNKEHIKEPTIEEIVKELGVTKEEIAFSLDAIQDPVSLQEPVYNDGTDNIYIMDQVRDQKNTDESWTENLSLMQAMENLTLKEKEIIARRFFWRENSNGGSRWNRNITSTSFKIRKKCNKTY